MRPRISKDEATFLVDCLVSRKQEIQKLIDRKDQLDREVSRLLKEAQQHNPYMIVDPQVGFQDKKAELQLLRAEQSKLYTMVWCYESLTQKFSAIASGTKQKGRHKRNANSYKSFLPPLLEKWNQI